MLRGRRDRHHRLGLLIPLTRGGDRDADPARGRRHRRARDRQGPADQVRRDGVRAGDLDGRDRVHLGRCTSSGVKGGIGIPGLDSWLVGFSTDTKVIGLDTVPPDDRPPANTMLHWAFDIDGGHRQRADRARRCGSASPGGASATCPRSPWFLRADGGVGRRGGRGARVRLDRDRGRAGSRGSSTTSCAPRTP